MPGMTARTTILDLAAADLMRLLQAEDVPDHIRDLAGQLARAIDETRARRAVLPAEAAPVRKA